MPDVRLPVITSTANPAIRAAADLRHRRGRDETGLTLVDGARELRRALEAGFELREAFVCPELLTTDDSRALLSLLRDQGGTLRTVARRAYSKVAFGDRSDGIVGVLAIPPSDLPALAERLARRVAHRALLAVVEGVEKPGNLGAILRSADAAGVDGLIAADPQTDLFNPNAIRASVGTIFTVPLAAAATGDAVAWLRERGLTIVAARVEAGLRYTGVDMTGPTAIVLGSESAGLSDAWRGPDVVAVRLPMRGAADSLNVSTAAAVLFYEARRQRDAGNV